MSTISHLHNANITVVLVYDDGTERGDWRVFPGVAEWRNEELVVHPTLDADDLLIPAGAYEQITPTTPEIRQLIGDSEYYVILHIAPAPDDPDVIRARFIPLD